MNMEREKNKLISQRWKEKKIFFFNFLSSYNSREWTTERKRNSFKCEETMNLSSHGKKKKKEIKFESTNYCNLM
jgi:hypothetical protein